MGDYLFYLKSILMTLKEILIRLNNDLTKLNKNEPTIVTYNNGLEFRQVGLTLMLDYLNPYFLVKKGFKFGILTQQGLNSLMYNAQQLIVDSMINSGDINLSLTEMSITFYKYFGISNPNLVGPQKFKELVLVNVTSNWIAKLYCKFYNNNTKILYKSLFGKKGK